MVFLVISGVGLLLLAPGLSNAVFVAGVLLLVVITATGVTIRTSRYGLDDAATVEHPAGLIAGRSPVR